MPDLAVRSKLVNPIIYSASVRPRFSDLDPYGHVNFKHYFDYVISSRLICLENRFYLSLGKLAKNGYGFYANQAEIKFLRPIVGLNNLEVESFVESVKDEVTLVIPFSIKDERTSTLYSEGKLFFTIIDLKTGKPAPLNDELKRLFFE
jgi:acyl-CoA thioesterase FadM